MSFISITKNNIHQKQFWGKMIKFNKFTIHQNAVGAHSPKIDSSPNSAKAPGPILAHPLSVKRLAGQTEILGEPYFPIPDRHIPRFQ